MIRSWLQGVALLLAAMWIASWAAVASAQPQERAKQTPAKARSLDQPLLDDLDRELLQGLPSRVKPAAGGASAAERENPPGQTRPAGDAVADSQDPIANLAQRMRTAQDRLARRDTSAVTQAEQESILKELDRLLQQAIKGGQGRQSEGDQTGAAIAGAGTSAAAGPPRDSTSRIERGSHEQTETADVKDVIRRIWGHLPEKLRDEMQAGVTEQFLPKYERLIEEYYKRLAEERPSTPNR